MKLSEIYTSIQGEGPRTGVPTTFLRFGGCNLRCPGWGAGVLPDGSVVDGCDTVFAVYPEWRDHWESVGVGEVVERLNGSATNICITGGEPLTQPKSHLIPLCEELLAKGHTIDLFTNGSRSLGPHRTWVLNGNVSVVMDYKLPGSGEYGSFDMDNLNHLQRYKDHLKFVCNDLSDVLKAVEDIKKLELWHFAELWFGVVWDKPVNRLLEDLRNHADFPYRLNLQTHKMIWDPEERKR